MYILDCLTFNINAKTINSMQLYVKKHIRFPTKCIISVISSPFNSVLLFHKGAHYTCCVFLSAFIVSNKAYQHKQCSYITLIKQADLNMKPNIKFQVSDAKQT